MNLSNQSIVSTTTSYADDLLLALEKLSRIYYAEMSIREIVIHSEKRTHKNITIPYLLLGKNLDKQAPLSLLEQIKIILDLAETHSLPTPVNLLCEEPLILCCPKNFLKEIYKNELVVAGVDQAQLFFISIEDLLLYKNFLSHESTQEELLEVLHYLKIPNAQKLLNIPAIKLLGEVNCIERNVWYLLQDKSKKNKEVISNIVLHFNIIQKYIRVLQEKTENYIAQNEKDLIKYITRVGDGIFNELFQILNVHEPSKYPALNYKNFINSQLTYSQYFLVEILHYLKAYQFKMHQRNGWDILLSKQHDVETSYFTSSQLRIILDYTKQFFSLSENAKTALKKIGLETKSLQSFLHSVYQAIPPKNLERLSIDQKLVQLVNLKHIENPTVQQYIEENVLSLEEASRLHIEQIQTCQLIEKWWKNVITTYPKEIFILRRYLISQSNVDVKIYRKAFQYFFESSALKQCVFESLLSIEQIVLLAQNEKQIAILEIFQQKLDSVKQDIQKKFSEPPASLNFMKNIGTFLWEIHVLKMQSLGIRALKKQSYLHTKKLTDIEHITSILDDCQLINQLSNFTNNIIILFLENGALTALDILKLKPAQMNILTASQDLQNLDSSYHHARQLIAFEKHNYRLQQPNDLPKERIKDWINFHHYTIQRAISENTKDDLTRFLEKTATNLRILDVQSSQVHRHTSYTKRSSACWNNRF